MKALILYSTTDGQTHHIANTISRNISDTVSCDLFNLNDVMDIDLSQYKSVLLGASIRYGHFNKNVDKFIAKNKDQLNAMASAFFAVNLTARKPEKRTIETNAYTRKFMASSPWQPKLSAVFAGSLLYPRYHFIDRIMIQLIMRITKGETDKTKEIEYTDWNQVREFSHQFEQLSS